MAFLIGRSYVPESRCCYFTESLCNLNCGFLVQHSVDPALGLSLENTQMAFLIARSYVPESRCCYFTESLCNLNCGFLVQLYRTTRTYNTSVISTAFSKIVQGDGKAFASFIVKMKVRAATGKSSPRSA